jgi:hypothetical protein
MANLNQHEKRPVKTYQGVRKLSSHPVYAEDSETEFPVDFSPIRDRIQVIRERLLSDEATGDAYEDRLKSLTDRFAELAGGIEDKQPKTWPGRRGC